MSKFKDSDDVLAYHKDHIFPAKISRVQKRGAVTQYFVHYKGWNVKWDEWVSEDRIMRDDERNMEFMTETNDAAVEFKQQNDKKKGAGEGSDEAGSDERSAGRKRKVDSARETEERDGSAPAGKLALPLALKLLVVQDWDLITNKRYLPRFTIKPCVDLDSAGASASTSSSSAAVPLSHSLSSVSMVLDDFQAFMRGERDEKSAGAGAVAGAAAGPPRKRARKDGDAGVSGAGTAPPALSGGVADSAELISGGLMVSASSGASSAAPAIPSGGKRGRGGVGTSSAAALGTAHTAQEIRAVKEVCDAVRMYFDKTMPILLLFRFERMMWDAWDKEARWEMGADERATRSLSTVAPPIFLLRMLVRFPSLVHTHGCLDKAETDTVGAVVAGLIRFLARNVKNKAYFGVEGTYAKASDEYCSTFDSALARGARQPKVAYKDVYNEAAGPPPQSTVGN